MSEHISANELSWYLKIILGKSKLYNDNADFIDEIDAHAAQCPKCFEKIQTARLLTAGILSDKETVSIYKKTDIKSSILLNIELIRDAVSNNIKALSRSVNDMISLAFVPNAASLAVARGTEDTVDAVPNDLLTSRVDFKINGIQIAARCEKGTDPGSVLLYIYSDKDIVFRVLCDGNELSVFKTGYDSVLKEHITVYKLSGNMITLGI